MGNCSNDVAWRWLHKIAMKLPPLVKKAIIMLVLNGHVMYDHKSNYHLPHGSSLAAAVVQETPVVSINRQS
jgi:hypothetical protein